MNINFFRNLVEQGILGISTVYLARVLSHEVNAEVCDIQPLSLIKATGGEAKKQAVLPNVPISQSVLGALGTGRTLEGVVAIVASCERDTNQTRKNEYALPSNRHHNKSDSIVIGCLTKNKNTGEGSAHSHENLCVLDTITEEDISNLRLNTQFRHSHNNIEVLNQLSLAGFENWNKAYGLSHSHENKDVLDGVTEEDVVDWNEAAETSHAHTNKDVIDKIATQDVTNWDEAFSLSHQLQVEVDNISALVQSTMGIEFKKNLLPYPASITRGGVAFTCDANGYMSCDISTEDKRGWSAENSQYSVSLKAGTYILSFDSSTMCTDEHGYVWVMDADSNRIAFTPLANKKFGSVEFTLDSDQTVYVMSKMFDGTTAVMIRGADVSDGNYEPYIPDLQTQIDTVTSEVGEARTSFFEQVEHDSLDSRLAADFEACVKEDEALGKRIDGVQETAHTHTNKETLDGISEQDVSNWDEAFNLSHTHENEAVLDGITAQNTANWNEAFEKKHTHENKTVLDGISNTDVGNWDKAFELSHSHTNKAVLDEITKQDTANWNEAFNLSHTHENKTVLDGITAVDTIPDTASSNPISSSIMAQTVGIKKNLLPTQPAGTKIKSNRITYTFNEDGSVTANGTTSDSGSTCTIYEGEPPFDGNGKYILSGCPYNSETSSYTIEIGEGTSTESYGFSIFDYGEATEFSLYKTTKYILVQIYIPANTTVENLRFFPMVRDASIEDDTYVPYVPDLQAQVADVSALAQSTMGVDFKKNLLPFPASVTKGGITFTCNTDGYMSSSNTTEDKRGWNAANSQYSVFLRAGKYVLTFHSAYYSSATSFNYRVCTSEYGSLWVMSADDTRIAVKALTNKSFGSVEFTLDSDQTIYVMSKLFDGVIAVMIRQAGVASDVYEAYTPDLQAQINALLARIETLEAQLTNS